MQNNHMHSQEPYLPKLLQKTLPEVLLHEIRKLGGEPIEEIRLHAGRFCTVSVGKRNLRTGYLADEHRLGRLLLDLCGGSLYAYSQTINQGFLSPGEGIRVGVCGSAAVDGNRVIGVGGISGLMIRIPHRVFADASPIVQLLQIRKSVGGILIYAPPGIGKTTLLRSVARLAASPEVGIRTVVVDSRSELNFSLEDRALYLDILEGYPRTLGIEIAIRSLGAQAVICDEIGSAEDAAAILQNANCGVPLIATAHASDLSELLLRPAFKELHRARVFHTYVGLSRNGTTFSYRFTAREELGEEGYAHI